jgi:hypothetical protein
MENKSDYKDNRKIMKTPTYNTKSIPKQPAHVPKIMKTEAYRITTSDVRTSLKKFTEIMGRTIPQKKGLGTNQSQNLTQPLSRATRFHFSVTLSFTLW